MELTQEITSWLDRGLSFEQAGKRVGMSRGAVSGVLRRAGIKRPRVTFWNEENTSVLLELYIDGVTQEDIAAVIGTTRSAVKSKVHALGLQDGDEEYSFDLRSGDPLLDALRRHHGEPQPDLKPEPHQPRAIPQPEKQVAVAAVQATVAAHFGITVSELTLKRRGHGANQTRYIAMWLARHFSQRPLAAIARAFECDRTSIRHGLKCIRALRLSDPQVEATLRDLVDEIERAGL